MVNDAANQVSDILATHGWSPAELDRPHDIPMARARVDLAYRQNVEADLAISALRAADAVTRASDDLAAHFDRLIDAGNVYPRPVILSAPTAAAPGTTVRENLLLATPGLYELTRILAYGADSATLTATLTLTFGGKLPPLPVSVTAGAPVNVGLGLPIDLPQQVTFNVVGGTGLWVAVLILTRLDVPV